MRTYLRVSRNKQLRRGYEGTNHWETSSPGQDEREGQYEPNFRRNIFLKER